MRSTLRPARGRLPHRGHADPRHHRRRRRRSPATPWPSGGCYFMRAPGRPADAADVRAARPRRDVRRDPAAADPARLRLGRAVYIEVSGLPADVRARHHRRGHRPGGDRHGGGRRAGHHHPAGHPGRARGRRGRGRGRRRPAVTIRNVPSFAVALDRRSTCPACGTVTYDLAFGGNFYAILELDQLGLPFDRARKDDILRRRAGDHGRRSTPPTRPSTRRTRTSPAATTSSLAAPGSTAAHSRHAMAIHPGWFDRSPCGTGTSARMAQLHARGELPLHTDFVNESFIGTRFIGRLVEETEVGGRPRRRADHHRPRVGHRDRAVPARPRRPVPGRLPALSGAPSRPSD